MSSGPLSRRHSRAGWSELARQRSDMCSNNYGRICSEDKVVRVEELRRKGQDLTSYRVRYETSRGDSTQSRRTRGIGHGRKGESARESESSSLLFSFGALFVVRRISR